MVFSSLTFVFCFLLITALLYFIMPGIRLKNAVLLLASLVFYSWAEPRLLLLLLADTLVAYVGGLLIARQKMQSEDALTNGLNTEKVILFVVIVLIIGALVYFKYFGFITEILAGLGTGITIAKIVLPTGISFYTFQILSYVIDLYTGKVGLQKNFFRLLLYVSFFPQLIAGPIVRYDLVEEEMGLRHTSLDDAEYGLKRFIIGLFKKVVLANGVAKIAEIIYAGDPYVYGSAFYWLAALAYTFQIYFDFCGYSDMAIGLGRIFGFHFAENFDYPYLSKSVSEFWSKWHISLSTWFRDYVYIPLGGNRVAKARWIFNFMCVWLLTGLWHGASYNFILWGLYYGVVLLAEKSVVSWLQDRKARRMGENAAEAEIAAEEVAAEVDGAEAEKEIIAEPELVAENTKQEEAGTASLDYTPDGIDFSYSGFSFEARYGTLLHKNADKVQNLSREKTAQTFKTEKEIRSTVNISKPDFSLSLDLINSLGFSSFSKETEERSYIRDLNEMLYGAPASEEPIPVPEAAAPLKPNLKDKDIYELNRKVKRFAEDAKFDSKIKGFADAIAQKLKVLLEKIKALWEKIKPLTEKIKSLLNKQNLKDKDLYKLNRKVKQFSETKLGQKVLALVGWLYTMFVVIIGWVLFNLEGLAKVGTALKTMFGGLPADLAAVVAADTEILRGFIFIPLCFVCIFPVKKLLDKLDETPAAILSTLIYLALFILCICLCIAEKYNPFIYFRF